MPDPIEIGVPDLGRHRLGNTDIPGVTSFAADRAGPHVVVTALVHGNELCGAWAILALLEREIRPRRGRLSLALVNLAAFDAFFGRCFDVTLLMVDDGSTDETPLVIERLRQRHPRRVLTLRLGENVGKAEAVRRGMELAMPPKIEVSQALGFSLYAGKAIINGRGNDLIELVHTNLFR